MPKHPKPPIPIDRWFQDQNAVQKLRQVIAEPSFQQAVAILKEVSGPSFGGLKDTETNNLRHAWYAGYRDAFNDLEKLTKLPENNKTSSTTLNEWTHIE